MQKILLYIVFSIFSVANFAGTVNNISTRAEFETFRNNVNKGNSYAGDVVVLNADIIVTGLWNQPIGNTSKYVFKGEFDGRGHFIGNNTENYTFTTDYRGIFGHIENANIHDVNIISNSFYGKNYMGGLVGYAKNSTITNVTTSNLVEGLNYVGGIVGYAENCTISRCVNTGSCFIMDENGATGPIGGIVGKMVGGTITDCFNAGFIGSDIGSNYVGGIAGESSGEIKNCLNVGSLGLLSKKGGIVGKANTGTKIENCFFDKQIVPIDIWSVSVGDVSKCSVSKGMNTLDLIGDKLQSYLTNWLYKDGLYPYLAENPVNRVASSPLIIGNTDNAEKVRAFAVDAYSDAVEWNDNTDLIDLPVHTGEAIVSCYDASVIEKISAKETYNGEIRKDVYIHIVKEQPKSVIRTVDGSPLFCEEQEKALYLQPLNNVEYDKSSLRWSIYVNDQWQAVPDTDGKDTINVSISGATMGRLTFSSVDGCEYTITNNLWMVKPSISIDVEQTSTEGEENLKIKAIGNAEEYLWLSEDYVDTLSRDTFLKVLPFETDTIIRLVARTKGIDYTSESIAVGDIVTEDSIFIKPDFYNKIAKTYTMPQGVVYAIKNDTAYITYYTHFSSIKWGFNGYEVKTGSTVNGGSSSHVHNEEVESDMDGYGNTQKILSYMMSRGFNYNTKECAAFKASSVGEGWYLPSVGEFLLLFQNKDTVNKVLKLIDGSNPAWDLTYIKEDKTEKTTWVWSSTQSDATKVWCIHAVGDESTKSKNESGSTLVVRPAKKIAVKDLNSLNYCDYCSTEKVLTINVSGILLPIELVYFSISTDNQYVTATWKSESETDFDHYELQVSLENGKWETVAVIYPNTEMDYSAEIELESSALYNFRLKMIDKNGDVEYSDVASELIFAKDTAYRSIECYSVQGVKHTVTVLDNGEYSFFPKLKAHQPYFLLIVTNSGEEIIKPFMNIH